MLLREGVHSALKQGVSTSELTEYCQELRTQGAQVLLSDQRVEIVFPATRQSYRLIPVDADLWRLDESGGSTGPPRHATN